MMPRPGWCQECCLRGSPNGPKGGGKSDFHLILLAGDCRLGVYHPHLPLPPSSPDASAEEIIATPSNPEPRGWESYPPWSIGSVSRFFPKYIFRTLTRGKQP